MCIRDSPEWNLIERFMEPILLPLGGHAAHAAEHAAHAHPGLGLELGLIALSLAVAIFGIWLARRFYHGPEAYDGEAARFCRPGRLADRFALAYRFLLNKYYVDELYDATVIGPIHRMASFCWRVIDVWVIDGAVNLSAFCTELSGSLLRFLQTGNVRNYALSVALGILALAVILW